MKKLILIVDDKESVAKVIGFYLKNDYDIVWFNTPIKAISWLQQNNKADLIISDIRMPEMNGMEFLSYIKHNELFKIIPIVMLSSEDSTSARIKFLEEGADDFILKPFNPMEIKIRIKKIIG